MLKISEKYAEIIFILGVIVSLFSFFFFLPVIVSLIYEEDVHLIFASVGVFSFSSERLRDIAVRASVRGRNVNPIGRVTVWSSGMQG